MKEKTDQTILSTILTGVTVAVTSCVMYLGSSLLVGSLISETSEPEVKCNDRKK